MARTTDPEEMDAPCVCSHCGDWFDLDEGRGSKRWYPNTVICAPCAREEQQEIESEEEEEEEEDEYFKDEEE